MANFTTNLVTPRIVFGVDQGEFEIVLQNILSLCDEFLNSHGSVLCYSAGVLSYTLNGIYENDKFYIKSYKKHVFDKKTI